MRRLLLALLAATSGCEQILGLDDIDAAGTVGETVTVTGKIVVHPRGNGQNDIGVEARDVATGALVPGSQDTTAMSGTFAVTAPTNYDGFLRFFNEDSGLDIHQGTYHLQDIFGFGNMYQLTAFEKNHDNLVEMAGLDPGVANLLFARIEVIDQNSAPLPGATVRVPGNDTLPIRYTDDHGEVVTGSGTMLATRDDQETFAAAYVFGLTVGTQYNFEAQIGGDVVALPYSIDVQADTIPTIVLKFLNR